MQLQIRQGPGSLVREAGLGNAGAATCTSHWHRLLTLKHSNKRARHPHDPIHERLVFRREVAFNIPDPGVDARLSFDPFLKIKASDLRMVPQVPNYNLLPCKHHICGPHYSIRK